MTSPGDWIDELFKAGTGYLGWTPKVVLNTPIPQLLLAIEGKFEFANKTTPFGGGQPKKPLDEKTVSERKATLDAIKAQAARKRIECQKQQKGS